jgi:hypothetical protein
MFPESNIYIPNFDSQGTSTIRTSNSYSRLSYKSLVTACHAQAWYHQQRFPEAIFLSHFDSRGVFYWCMPERGSDDSPNKGLRHSHPAQSQRIHDSLFRRVCANMRICVDACVGYEPVRRNFYLYSPRSLPLSLWISAQYTETPAFQYLVGDVYSAASRPITCGVRGSTLWQIKGSPNLLFILL